MTSTRSGASYNPSSSSPKGYRHDYCRSQSVTEGQGSVNGSQTDKLCHSEADNTVLPSRRSEMAQEASVDIYKASRKAYNNALQPKSTRFLQICGITA
ncbi:hypothetical protein O181_007763 [Austropuccinia psidii MF-1]|uniref:Uncharacterized protein n=1 Tax=Austropuccinia psidii MF-1 TaxID=1389203 RepID=A0A9Q3BMV1_9BASI|nr:hypothetical protein [Austropuccinia psidii MF-1]